MENNNISAIHTARGSIYMFLHNCILNIPDNNFYNMLNAMVNHLSEIYSTTDNQNIIAGYDGIKKFIEQRQLLTDNELDNLDMDINREYTTYFCLPSIAPQEESYYTSEDNMLHQKANEEVMRLFYKYGFVIDRQVHLDYDNICMEFAFMSKLSFLIAEEVDATKMYNLLKEQYDFHINHFDKWIYTYLDKLISLYIVDAKLYKFIALFSKGFIQEDKLLLTNLLGINKI